MFLCLPVCCKARRWCSDINTRVNKYHLTCIFLPNLRRQHFSIIKVINIMNELQRQDGLVITSIIKCGMKLVIHSPTLQVAIKFFPVPPVQLFPRFIHDDVIKWKHFPRYWPFVRGIHRSPVNSPHKGQ